MPGPGTFVEVAVNAGQPARIPFTYEVPTRMEVAAGQAVFVPFGSRVLQGVVLGEVDKPAELERVRAVEAVADPEPVLDAARIALARWMSETYLAPLWDCVATCLPPGYGQKPVTMVSPVNIPPLLPSAPREQRILAFLGEHGRVTADAVREAVPGTTLAHLRRLQESGHLTVAQGLGRPAGRPKVERRVRLLREPADALLHAEKLLAKTPRSVEGRMLSLLGESRDVALVELREGTGATPKHMSRLTGDGWLKEYEARVERDPLSEMEFEAKGPPALTAGQSTAAEAIARGGGAWLLHGVTGSGKTEVYLDLARRELDAGRGVIVLVPEISLTPQAVRRYGERFGETLAVVHSGLGTGELYDQWYRIERGEARVVVGSRSGLFAPVRNLGLIVIDEEHEWTYKQVDPPPRYHARDAAMELGRLTGASVVLGSATPDVVTYHRAKQGQVGLVELGGRVVPGEDGGTREGRMADIAIVDMREELAAGNRSVFARELRSAILDALADGDQAILFVNRRGSARFILCRDCGFVPMCPSCQLALSLDTRNVHDPRTTCHSCGRSWRLEDRCPRCNGARFRPFGVGTQRIEQLAKEEFPGARVARWDSETASRKGAHEDIVAAVEGRGVDILVGTQMLAKGLDLPAMTVVGVVDADVGVNLPDYHAHERVFQLMTQVAGRAGRRDKPGRVFIQTYNPEEAPLVFAANHDYAGFFEHEIAHRRRTGYPPFSRLARLVYSHPNQEHGLQEASRMASEIRVRRDAAGRADPEVLGPTPAFIPRVRGRYRWQLILRGREPSAILRELRTGEGWSVDIDPANLL